MKADSREYFEVHEEWMDVVEVRVEELMKRRGYRKSMWPQLGGLLKAIVGYNGKRPRSADEVEDGAQEPGRRRPATTSIA